MSKAKETHLWFEKGDDEIQVESYWKDLKIRRCKDPTDKENLVARRDFLTAEIGELREKLKLAKRIIKDSPALEEKLETEKQLIREWYFPERQRNKEKDYEER